MTLPDIWYAHIGIHYYGFVGRAPQSIRPRSVFFATGTTVVGRADLRDLTGVINNRAIPHR